MSALDPERFNAEIEALTEALERTQDVDAQRSARELVSLVLQFHRSGIRRIVDIVGAHKGIDWRQRFEADPNVAGLLALHEISLAETGVDPPAVPATRLIPIQRGPIANAGAPLRGHVHDRRHCEHCGELLGDTHHHVIDVVDRTLACCCRACWLVAGARPNGSSRKQVSDRYLAEPHFALTAAQWEALQLPVDVVFFLRNSVIGRTVAFYPSPAGATESSLPLEAWRDVERSNPWIGAAAPDVEAVLVRKKAAGEQGYDAFIIPIDACYDLVGRVRLHWRGFNGGDRVRAEIEGFFSDILQRATTLRDAAAEHA